MNVKSAKNLQNRDEIIIKTLSGTWEIGYVLGEPKLIEGRMIIPTMSSDGFREVDHTDVR